MSVTDEGLGSLSETLKRLVAIESLTLSFSGCKGINEKTLSSLGEGLKRLKKLEKLFLDFSQ